MRRAALLLLALVSLPSHAQEPPSREGSVRREMRVGRVEIDAYVTASSGEPIPDLSPAEFQVAIDGRPATVESAEWIPADRSEGAASEALAGAGSPASSVEAAAQPGPRYPPGRLLVFFFQSDFQFARLIGLVRMANQARRLIETLLPTDRVAVISYDSHLKLRQDFTDDRDALSRAVFEAIKTGPAAAPDPARFPSLAAGWDLEAARRAATPDRGLAVAAQALARIPGAKSLLFFGWGLHIRNDPKNVDDWVAALRGLAAARTSLFALDVTDADYHTLETTLEVASDLTGGTYEKTHELPQLALRRVARAISGRYVLVVVRPEGAAGFHTVSVRLAGRKGRVNARQYYED
jgi:VWFA-related protein